MKQGPDVLLIDFDESVADALRARRYPVTTGSSTAKLRTRDPNAPFKILSEQSLPPVYEQKVIFYNAPRALKSGTVGLEEPEVKKIEDSYPFEHSAVEKWLSEGGIIVAFVNSHTGKDELSWLPARFNLIPIPGDSRFSSVEGDRFFGRFALQMLDSMRPSVKLSDAQGAQPVAKNLGGEPVAAYFNRGKGVLLILPDMEDKGSVVIRLLEKELREVRPESFAGHDRTAWMDADEYFFPGFWREREELEDMRRDFEKRLGAKERSLEEAREQRTPFLGLLAASEKGNGMPPFITVVDDSLQFLGFRVESGSQEHRPKTARGGLLDVTSQDGARIVASVIAAPDLGEVNDYINLLGAVTDRIRETGDTKIRGLLIYNNQFELPAVERGLPFDGDENLLENMSGQNIGVITGQELFRMVQDVNGDLLDKDKARQELSQTGLITYTSRALKNLSGGAVAAARSVIVPREEKEPAGETPARKAEPPRAEPEPAPKATLPAEPAAVVKPEPEPAPKPEPAPAPKPEAAETQPRVTEPAVEPLRPPESPVRPRQPVSAEPPQAEGPPAPMARPEPPAAVTKEPPAPSIAKPAERAPEPPRAKPEPPGEETREKRPAPEAAEEREAPAAAAAGEAEPPKPAVKEERPAAGPALPDVLKITVKPEAEAPKPPPETPKPPKLAVQRVEPVQPTETSPAAEKEQPKERKMDYNKVVRKLLKWE
ncbi:MAG: hypothetical protein ACYC55_00165 [Candidatus Geothermincolia bacterium]